MTDLDLVVIVPTRERPESVYPLATCFRDTTTAATLLILAVDSDDPTLQQYRDHVGALKAAGDPVRLATISPGGSMVRALNTVAGALALGQLGSIRSYAVAFMGDDHRPRTHGWDAAYVNALRKLGSGLVYGNDCVQRELLPTQVAMTLDVVTALSYMAPPTLTHLYVDDWWRALGTGAGALEYLEDVIVQHCHPFAGTGEMDPGYERVNSEPMYHRDSRAFRALRDGGDLERDIERLRGLRTKGGHR